MGRGILRGAGGDENLKSNFIWPYRYFFFIFIMSQANRKRNFSGPDLHQQKKKKYYCKYCPEWTKAFDFVRPSGIGADMAYCNLCKFSIALGGLYDIKRHASSAHHI